MVASRWGTDQWAIGVGAIPGAGLKFVPLASGPERLDGIRMTDALCAVLGGAACVGVNKWGTA